jgi:hypothetical protein
MFKRIMLYTTLITFGIVLSLNAQPQPSPVQPSPVKRTILQRADVPGTNLEIIYATVEIAPGFKAGRHNHPGVVIGHVVEGDFWVRIDGQPEQVSQSRAARCASPASALRIRLAAIVRYVAKEQRMLDRRAG